MKVRMDTIEVNDETRRALRRFVGKTGMATREEVRMNMDGLIQDYLNNIVGDYGEE